MAHTVLQSEQIQRLRLWKYDIGAFTICSLQCHAGEADEYRQQVIDRRIGHTQGKATGRTAIAVFAVATAHAERTDQGQAGDAVSSQIHDSLLGKRAGIRRVQSAGPDSTAALSGSPSRNVKGC